MKGRNGLCVLDGRHRSGGPPNALYPEDGRRMGRRVGESGLRRGRGRREPGISSFIIFLLVRDFSSSFIMRRLPKCRRSRRTGFWHVVLFARQSNLYTTVSAFISLFPSSFPFLRSSFLLFIFRAPLRSACLLFLHHFSSSLIMSPLRSSFLLFAHHFLCPKSAPGHVGRVLGELSFCGVQYI